MLKEILMGLLGGGMAGGAVKQVTQPQKKGMKLHGMNVVNGGGRSNIFRPELLQQRQPMQRIQPRPMMPASQFYLGSTNYGTPQDNMIDTSMGYLTDDQFNQGYTGQLQGGNPYGSLQDYRNRLRVR